MVRSRGIEGTLLALRESGVYVSFEEFKGRAPLCRGEVSFPVSPGDFDNPFLSRQLLAETGGSTGAGRRIETDLEHLAAISPYLMVAKSIHGALGIPSALWRGPLPDGSGINNILRSACHGHLPDRWFTLSTPGYRPAMRFRAADKVTVLAGRLFGRNVPVPEPLSLDGAGVIARWAGKAIAERGNCLIVTQVSRALRVAAASREEGISLEGAVFMVAGEPLTPGKERGIRASGARLFTTYGLAETGRIGMGCGSPEDGTDVHLMKDGFALIPYERRVPGPGISVPAFNITTLLPSTPKILLNVEVDDYGTLEERSCGCRLGELGFTEHLRGMRSFSKLTGEGVSLVGSEMMKILDEDLPARLGGSPLDYQLAEVEDEGGFTRLRLLVSPGVGPLDESVVLDTVMECLGRGSDAAGMARAIWNEAHSLQVERAEPVWSSRGKLMPLYLPGRKEKIT